MPSLSQPGAGHDLDDVGDFESPHPRTLSPVDYERRLAELWAQHESEETCETGG